MTSLFLTLVVGPFTWPDAWQRVIAAVSPKEAKHGLRWAILGFAVPALFLTIFTATTQVYNPGIDPEVAVVYALQNYAASFLAPLIFVIVVAVLMSSLDTTLFGGAVSILKDVLARLPFYTDKTLTRKRMRPTLMLLIVLEIAMAHVLIEGFTYLFFALAATACLAPAAIAICVNAYKVSEFAAFWSVTLSFIAFVVGVFMGFISAFEGIIPLMMSAGLYIVFEGLDRAILKKQTF